MLGRTHLKLLGQGEMRWDMQGMQDTTSHQGLNFHFVLPHSLVTFITVLQRNYRLTKGKWLGQKELMLAPMAPCHNIKSHRIPFYQCNHIVIFKYGVNMFMSPQCQQIEWMLCVRHYSQL